MTRKKEETGKRICYVRMREYYGCFFKTKYGGEPIIFSEDEALGVIVEQNIVQNPDLRMLTRDSYSWLAFNYEQEGKVFDIDIATPLPEEKEEFVGIAFPETVYRRGGASKTSGNWQLSKKGVKMLREQMKKEFWLDCREFITSCKNHAKAIGETFTIEDSISDFMQMYNIPMSHFDNLIRNEQRIRKNLPAETGKQRDLYEQNTGNVFIYT